MTALRDALEKIEQPGDPAEEEVRTIKRHPKVEGKGACCGGRYIGCRGRLSR